MKGINELTLNESTMIEAVQFWLNSRMVPPVPKVTAVKTSGDYGNKSFTVALEAATEPTNDLPRSG